MASVLPGLTIDLSLNHTDVTRSMKSLKSDISLMNSEMKKNMSAFDYSERSAKKYETRLGGLQKKLELQKQVVNSARKELETMNHEFGENSEEAKKAERNLNNAEATYNNLERSVNKATTQLEEFNREQKIADSNWTKAGKAMDDYGDKLKSFGGGMKDVGKKASMYITAPLVGLGTIATKTGIEFDDGMSKVKAVSGATGEELEKLRDKAREVGATTRFSATDGAEAFNYMALAGWKTADMLDGVDGMMMLAAASGEDLGQVSDIVTDGLSAFGLQAADSGRMADVLAAASANANTDVSGLGAAFQYVAPVAGALGFSIEDTSKAIGIMSNAGIKGQKAGTALRTMMTNLAKPTKQMQDAMDELGISLTDSDGNMKDLDSIMGELRGSFDGLTKDQQANYAATIFGKEAMSGALAIINESEENFNNLGEAINNSAGEAERMGKEMEDNLGGSLRQLKSVFEEVMIGIYDVIQPVLRDAVDFMSELLSKFSELSDEIKRTAVVIGGLAAAIGPVLAVGGTMVIWLGSLMKVLAPVLTTIGQLGGVTGTLGTILGALTGPVGLTVLAIGGLATAFGIAYSKSETFRSIVGTALESVKNVALIVKDEVVGFAGELFGKIKEFWQNDGQQTLQAFKNIWNGILIAVEFVSPAIELIFQGLMLVIKMVWDNIKGAITGALNVILGAVKIFSGIFTGDFSKMWEGTKQLFVGAIQTVWNVFSLLFYGRILKGVGSLVKLFSGSIRGLWTSVVGFFKNMFTGSVNQVTNLYKQATNIGNLIKNGLSSAIRGAKDSVINLFNIMKNKSLDHLNKIVDGVKGLPGKMKDALIAGKDKVVSGIKSLGNSMAETLGKVVNGVIGGINTVMEKIGISKSISDWSVPTFSTGTGQGSPTGNLTRNGKIAMDTLATVGDKGPGNGTGTRELVHYPNGKVGLYDDDATIFAPKGTTIFSNQETEALLGQVPQFSKGTGFFKGIKNIASKAFDYITNPSKIFNAIVDNYMQSWNVGAFMKDFGKGMWKTAKSGLLDWVKSRFSEAGAGKKQKWMDKYPITTPYSPNAPVPGYPTSFNKGHHYGIDWGTPSGTNLTSPMAGTVKKQNDHGGGNVARLDYGKGAMYFLHMNSVKPGKVGIGKSLGFSGNTGAYTTGAHVHVQDEDPKTAFLQNKNTHNPLKKLKGLSRGGLLKREGLFWGAEKNKEEAVVPIDGSNEMHKLFNYIAGKVAQPTPTSGVKVKGNVFDTSRIEEKLDKLIEVMSQFVDKEINMNVNGLNIAKATFEDVDRLIQENKKRHDRYRGVTI